MKKVLFFLFSFLVGLGLFSWAVKWVGWSEIKEILFTFSGWQGIVILGITLLIWLAGIWEYKFIFKSQGYNFSVRSLGEILLSSFTISYLFPTTYFGGEAFKVYAFKKRFSLPWEKNLAAVIIEKLLFASIFLFLLISGAVSFLLLTKLPFGNFWAISLIIVGGLAILLTAFYFKIFTQHHFSRKSFGQKNYTKNGAGFKKESILKWFLKFFAVREKKNHLMENIEKEIFRFFDFKKFLIWKGLGIAFLRYFLIFIRCWFLIFFLGVEVNILIVLAILFFSCLAYLFPFPAKVGSAEMALAFAFGSLGLGAAAGITFSFILRGAEILIVLLGLLFLIKLGIGFFIEKKLKI